MRSLLVLALFLSGTAFAQYPPKPEPKPDVCTLRVLIEMTVSGLDNLDDAEALCEPYSEFCVVRKFEDGTWESDLRLLKVFEGKRVRDVLERFDRFLRRSRFTNDGFDVNLNFFNCGR